MTKYNAIYRKLKDEQHSGWNSDKYFEEGKDWFLVMYNKTFKIPKKCWTYLIDWPKFDPMADPEEADPDAAINKKKKATINKMAAGQTSTMERPWGAKKAKAAVKTNQAKNDHLVGLHNTQKAIAASWQHFNKLKEREQQRKK